MELSYEATALAFILVGVVTLWVTEALPLPVSALLAAAACVVAGVAPASEVFRPFSQPLVFLFIGSFILAEAIRIHRLDRRLAFAVLALPMRSRTSTPGLRPSLGAIGSTTLCSWTPSTSTTCKVLTTHFYR